MKLLAKMWMICILVCISCKSGNRIIPSNNDGGYIISNVGSKDSLMIQGFVKDVESLNPIPGSVIKLHCTKVYTDDKGYYSIRLTRNLEPFRLLTSFIGYRSIETKEFTSNNSLRVDFYLEEDDKPFIDCPLIPSKPGGR